jgi:hypothetical protein
VTLEGYGIDVTISDSTPPDNPICRHARGTLFFPPKIWFNGGHQQEILKKYRQQSELEKMTGRIIVSIRNNFQD